MTGGYHDHPDTRGVFIELWLLDLVDGDYPTAMYLSQLLWRCQPAKNGARRPHMIERHGEQWLHRADADWWDDCRLGERTVRRIKSQLKKRGLIEACQIKNGAGTPVAATRPLYDAIRVEAATRSDPTPGRHVQGPDAETSSRPDVDASKPPLSNPLPKDTETPIAERPASPPSATGGATLFGDAPTSERSAEDARAERVARAIWERLDRKPTNKFGFTNLRRDVKRMLGGGEWTEDDLLLDAPAAFKLTEDSIGAARKARLARSKPVARSSGNGRLQGPAQDEAIASFIDRNNLRGTPT